MTSRARKPRHASPLAWLRGVRNATGGSREVAQVTNHRGSTAGWGMTDKYHRGIVLSSPIVWTTGQRERSASAAKPMSESKRLASPRFLLVSACNSFKVLCRTAAFRMARPPRFHRAPYTRRLYSHVTHCRREKRAARLLTRKSRLSDRSQGRLYAVVMRKKTFISQRTLLNMCSTSSLQLVMLKASRDTCKLGSW